jgi:hypothetical protein
MLSFSSSTTQGIDPHSMQYDFLLLDVNDRALQAHLTAVLHHGSVAERKSRIQMLFDYCVSGLCQREPIRRNALQTLCSLIRAVFASDTHFDVATILHNLWGIHEADAVFQVSDQRQYHNNCVH